jgi:hypothetical protein
MRIASPERWWRAALAPLVAGWAGWYLAGAFRLGLSAGTSRALPVPARIAVTCAAFAAGAVLAVLTARAHLLVDGEGLADHRIFTVRRVPWQQITGFEVGRPGALWGGFCVIAVRRDGSTLDLMSTRAYTRIPSARHIDELQRICWSLEAANPCGEEAGPGQDRNDF